MKKKIIFFRELNLLNFFIAIVLKIFLSEIYYLNLSKKLRNIRFIKFFEYINIKWISYNNYQVKEIKFIYKKRDLYNSLVKSYLSKSQITPKFENFIVREEEYKLKKFLTSMYLNKSSEEILSIAEILIIAKKHNKPSTRKVYFWIEDNYLFNIINSNNKKYVNLCPGLFEISLKSFEILKKVIFKLINLFKNKILSLFNFNNKKIYGKDPRKSEVAFFPHQGIYYGICNLFLKDYFYNKSKTSPFDPKKIIHFSYGDFKVLTNKNIKFYKKFNIIFLEWLEINLIQTLKIIFALSKFFVFNFSVVLKNINLFFTFSKYYYLIKINIEKIHYYKNIKIYFIGYDILFPIELAIALKIKKKITITNQGRQLSAWWAPPNYFDYYLCYGPKSLKAAKKRFIIKKTIPFGPIQQFKYYQKKNKLNILNSNKYKKKILILDYSSVLHEYTNGRLWANNWRNNKEFYEDIYKLCIQYKKNLFLIKSKDNIFKKVKYLSQIITKLKKLNNVIFLNNDKINPFQSVNLANIVIGQHSSLIEEAFCAGKPIIIYDKHELHKEMFNFGNNLLSTNFNNFSKKFENYSSNPYRYNKKLNKLRKKLVYNSSIDSKKKLDNILNKIFVKNRYKEKIIKKINY